MPKSSAGIGYLQKKSWHPGRLDNIEKVWQAEEKIKEEKKKKMNV